MLQILFLWVKPEPFRFDGVNLPPSRTGVHTIRQNSTTFLSNDWFGIMTVSGYYPPNFVNGESFTRHS